MGSYDRLWTVLTRIMHIMQCSSHKRLLFSHKGPYTVFAEYLVASLWLDMNQLRVGKDLKIFQDFVHEIHETSEDSSLEVDYPLLEYMYSPRDVAPMQSISRSTTCPQSQCTVVILGNMKACLGALSKWPASQPQAGQSAKERWSRWWWSTSICTQAAREQTSWCGFDVMAGNGTWYLGSNQFSNLWNLYKLLNLWVQKK